jgi:hypothetical protein
MDYTNMNVYSSGSGDHAKCPFCCYEWDASRFDTECPFCSLPIEVEITEHKFYYFTVTRID